MIGKAEFSVVTAVDEHAAVSTGRSLGAMTCKRTIATTRRLRDEIKFDNHFLLKKQLLIDEVNCKKYFNLMR